MPWLLVDLAVALLAIVGLLAVSLRLWRTTKAFGSAMRTAGETLGAARDELPAVQRGPST